MLKFLFEIYVLEPLFGEMIFLAGMDGCETSVVQ